MNPLRNAAFSLGLASLVVLAAGCYPDESSPGQYEELRGLVLPLADFGLELSAGTLDPWLSWLNGEQPEPFDLGDPDHNFALGLRLNADDNPEAWFLGQTISLVRDPQEALLIELEVSNCDECTFSVVIYYYDQRFDPPELRTFSGTSEAFTVDGGDLQQPVVLDASEHETGRVELLPGSTPPEPGARAAALDPSEMVRLPAVSVAAGAGGPVAVLADLPFERELAIQYDPFGDDRFYSTLETVTLDEQNSVQSVSLP